MQAFGNHRDRRVIITTTAVSYSQTGRFDGIMAGDFGKTSLKDGSDGLGIAPRLFLSFSSSDGLKG
jgi:hypothetical protein